jgi:hypothetical protein
VASGERGPEEVWAELGQLLGMAQGQASRKGGSRLMDQNCRGEQRCDLCPAGTWGGVPHLVRVTSLSPKHRSFLLLCPLPGCKLGGSWGLSRPCGTSVPASRHEVPSSRQARLCVGNICSCSIAQASLGHCDPPVSASQLLGLQVCTTVPGSFLQL